MKGTLAVVTRTVAGTGYDGGGQGRPTGEEIDIIDGQRLEGIHQRPLSMADDRINSSEHNTTCSYK